MWFPRVRVCWRLQVEGVSQKSPTYRSLAVLMVFLCALFALVWLAAVVISVYRAARAKRPTTPPIAATSGTPGADTVVVASPLGRRMASPLNRQRARMTHVPDSDRSSGGGSGEGTARGDGGGEKLAAGPGPDGLPGDSSGGGGGSSVSAAIAPPWLGVSPKPGDDGQGQSKRDVVTTALNPLFVRVHPHTPVRD